MTNEQECGICNDDISISTGRTIMGCGHQFHTKCLVQWLQKPDGTGSCPYCRKAPGEMERLVQPPVADNDDDESVWLEVQEIGSEWGGISSITPLMVAARNKDLEKVRTLLDEGAEVDAKDSEGDTALQWAEDDACRSLLMQRGADIRLMRSFSHLPHSPRTLNTALIAACESNSLLCVKALLDLHANPNYADPMTGISPILETIRSESSHSILSELILHGADVLHVDKMGMNAFLWLADVGCDTEYMSVLLKACGNLYGLYPPTVMKVTKIQSIWRRFVKAREYKAARTLLSF
jgi:hypothetical protein